MNFLDDGVPRRIAFSPRFRSIRIGFGGLLIGLTILAEGLPAADRPDFATSVITASSDEPFVGDVVEFLGELSQLRCEAKGTEVLSTGADLESSLRIGGRITKEQALQGWKIGTVIPCWYAPQNPQDVIMRRGFGGAYWFARLPIPLFSLGLHPFCKTLSGNRASGTSLQREPER